MHVARQNCCHFNLMSKMHLSSDSMLVLFSSPQLYRSIEHVCTLNSEFHKKIYWLVHMTEEEFVLFIGWLEGVNNPIQGGREEVGLSNFDVWRLAQLDWLILPTDFLFHVKATHKQYCWTGFKYLNGNLKAGVTYKWKLMNTWCVW